VAAGRLPDDSAARGHRRHQDTDRQSHLPRHRLTAYLKNKGTLEAAQHIANHESPRTTKLYDRRNNEISLLVNLGQERLLLFAQNESSISIPFLVVVVFWLTVLFVSFGLFAPRNPTAIVTLLVAAISVAGALYLILDLDHPFSGLMQISSAPLRSALSMLGKQSSIRTQAKPIYYPITSFMYY
jgi:hypothetical protein